jgi:hypothetical protein
MSAELLSVLAAVDVDVAADPLPEAWPPDLFVCTELCDCAEAPVCADAGLCAAAVPAPTIPAIRIGRKYFTREPLLWAELISKYTVWFPQIYK